ncbi:uncharacterized protein LOC131956379 [Physella acuta]|uniref:uncharacterized protein LOC131956379 n=1 Tax=Physella acuta TaxID=109671 RepID=UPI0027DDC052|nr:uncharacterized protein LOC131956379 [Physella acuta]
MSAFRIRSIFVILTPVCVFLLYCFSFKFYPDQSKFIAHTFKHAISNEINRRIVLERKEKFDKWIVVTSVFQPSKQLRILAQIPGWRLVVVGDRKTPSNWSLPGCDYLSLNTQKHLGFSLAFHLPLGSYARKNIGYLYAILNGAKFIYETDDDNSPEDNLNGFVLTPSMSGLMFVGNNVFNPYTHFGQSTLWPRGYPLSHIGKKQNRQYK